ncbi:MAG TPA: hypothetical protein VHY33_13350 [Thermoanaerobaculia bacterium]|jgi:hypothetical protein|nr:hypothetical protein [Thermoanaerobaculia bacterium]
MTDETRILRTVGIPIVIAIILLVAVPKMCTRAVLVAKARQARAPHEPGLHIESAQKPAVYPSGLDAERIRYLLEVDSRFSTAYTVHIAKSASVDDALIAAALQKLGYLEQAPDGTRTLTRDGLLHLDGVIENENGWIFPVAKREFEAVPAIEGDHSNAHATIVWKWQPNTAGAALLPHPRRHEATADFSSGATGWTMTGLTVDDELE